MVQLPEPCDNNSEAYKAGYKNIADISSERIRRVIKKIEEERSNAQEQEVIPVDLGFKFFKLSPSNFKIWRTGDITEEIWCNS
ncbi:hypothetical protein [Chitinophaga pinensis]|nr:hypothetical protein [Chitinophaga pinensis]